MNEMRRAARWRRRRIIFNNDGDDIHNAPSVNLEHDVADNRGESAATPIVLDAVQPQVSYGE